MYKRLFVLFILQCSLTFADEPSKIYVTSKNLRYVNNEFILFTDKGVFATEALFTDENGLYVKAGELEKLRVSLNDKGREKFWRDLLKERAPHKK
jgi:hypothetical protein